MVKVTGWSLGATPCQFFIAAQSQQCTRYSEVPACSVLSRKIHTRRGVWGFYGGLTLVTQSLVPLVVNKYHVAKSSHINHMVNLCSRAKHPQIPRGANLAWDIPKPIAFQGWSEASLPLECAWVERFRLSELTVSYAPGVLGTLCLPTTQKLAGEDQETSLILFFQGELLGPF